MIYLKTPDFWYRPQIKIFPALLTPIEWAVTRVIEARSYKHHYAWKAPVPVLCCGNMTTGGTGKTTVVIDFARRLILRGKIPHILTRGYKGRYIREHLVNRQYDTVYDVGDEALLLAEYCPVWVGTDRVKTARAAINAGADCLLMDDGFQNPGLYKTFSLLIVDGITGVGNGHILPAGPLREKVDQALTRASALLLVDKDLTAFATYITQQKKQNLPIYRGYWRQSKELLDLKGKNCIAFAGIGRPKKFFLGLQKAGIFLQQTISYPDHYYYKRRDIDFLATLAYKYNSILVTTPKDTVRLPSSFRQYVKTVGVTLYWNNPTDPEHILDTLLGTKT